MRDGPLAPPLAHGNCVDTVEGAKNDLIQPPLRFDDRRNEGRLRIGSDPPSSLTSDVGRLKHGAAAPARFHPRN